MLTGHWYIAGPVVRLGRKPVSTLVGDHRVVLFRDEQRRANALVDRCPHRGVPLSLGSVVDGTVRCRYHGWRFAGTGTCVEVPSLIDPVTPNRCNVVSYPCVTQDGYVWVFIGDTQP